MTLYFAKEIPLAPKQHHRLLDSAPLLDDPRQDGIDNSESKVLRNLVDHKVGKSVEGTFEMNRGTATVNTNAEEDGVETFNNSPGAVLVNLLTSLRHLPVGMHSVLIVMALTWVS